MAITVPTFAFGRRPTAAELNQMAAALSALKNPPHCFVYQSVATNSMASSASTALNFDAELMDTNIMHDNVTNNSRITVNTAGRYLFRGQASIASNGVGYRWAQFRVNGATLKQEVIMLSAPAGVASEWTVSTEIQMAVNDYVELIVTQGSGSTLATATGRGTTWMEALKVSE